MPPKRRLSEGSDGPDAGVEDPEANAGTGGAEEEEKVRAGPGRPKKKKVDPSQQLQVCICLNFTWHCQSIFCLDCV